MALTQIFPGSRIFLNVDAASREALFAFLSERAAEFGIISEGTCAKALETREELGSTGLGNGIAIPHARIAGIETSIGMLATLARPIDFEAVDQEPVDVVLMLLMPEQSGGDQIKTLSRIAKMARDEPLMNALRRATTVAEVTALLADADADSGAY